MLVKVDTRIHVEKLTIFGLEVAVEYCHASRRRLGSRGCAEPQHRLTNFGGVDAIVTTVQGGDQLGKGAPDKRFLRILILLRQITDHPAQVAISAVFHVEVKVLRGFEVLAMVVADDVWVAQCRQDLEFGVELLALLLRHLEVTDLFPAENHVVDLSAHLSDDSKRAMAWWN